MKLFRRRPSEDSLDKELRFHLEAQIADYIAEGLPPEEARRRALLEFGGVDLAKEQCRDVRPRRWLDALIRDVRHALRGLARDPGFTATSLIVLALGIGGVTAIFTVVNDLAIQTPPFEAPERLAVIRETVDESQRHTGRRPPEALNFYRLRGRLRSFEDVTGYQLASMQIRGLEESMLAMCAWTPANFASTLGLPLIHGRWFAREESREGAPVVVLSEDLWRRAFHADPDIVGKTVELWRNTEAAQAYTIVGVAPRIRRVPGMENIELFVPNEKYLEGDARALSWLAGRLAEGVSLEQAQAELSALQATLLPDQNYTNGGRLIVVWSLVSDSLQLIRTGLSVVFGAAVCVLLVACANVASLLLGRASARQKEMAVRTGLGAGRGRLFAQVITESAVLATAGGALGVLAAWAGVRGLMAIRYSYLPEVERTSPDLTVLAFALGVALLT